MTSKRSARTERLIIGMSDDDQPTELTACPPFEYNSGLDFFIDRRELCLIELKPPPACFRMKALG